MKQFEYEQQLAHLKMSVDDIREMLSNKPIAEWAYIIHDKDKDTEPHIHVMVKLANSNMSVDYVCKWFNDEPQFINIKQSRWGSKLSYLCHRTPKDRDKFQYDPSEVVANFDYPERLNSITEEVSRKMEMGTLLDEIACGNIREYNLTKYVDVETFSKYKLRIMNALEYYRREIMTNPDRNIEVIMISGPAGVGKTTYAKQYCKNKGVRCCVSSSSNDPMQDYKGEPVLILDDLRHDAFKYHDFLKLLDNHTKSTTASRYTNKAFIGDTIIITSPDKIWSWYPNNNENKQQLYRRITTYIEMNSEVVTIYRYNKDTREYDKILTAPNTLKMTFKETKEQTVAMIKAFGIEMTPEVEEQILSARPELDNKVNEELLETIDTDDLPF